MTFTDSKTHQNLKAAQAVGATHRPGSPAWLETRAAMGLPSGIR